MRGAIERMIRSQGNEFDVLNAAGGGGRTAPDYQADGTLVGVIERRGLPQTATDSDGTEVKTDLEIRAVPEDTTTLRAAGSPDGAPTKLEHPNGTVYRVLELHEEDSGVTVLTVVTE